MQNPNEKAGSLMTSGGKIEPASGGLQQDHAGLAGQVSMLRTPQLDR